MKQWSVDTPCFYMIQPIRFVKAPFISQFKKLTKMRVYLNFYQTLVTIFT